MKVIGLTDNFQGSAPSGTANGFPGIFLMADSTLLKDGKPFFVPDFSADMVARPTFAIHMNRLGKNIAAKFANRYYAEVTVGLSIVARDIEQRLPTCPQHLPPVSTMPQCSGISPPSTSLRPARSTPRCASTAIQWPVSRRNR